MDVVVEGGVETDVDAVVAVGDRRGVPFDRVAVHDVEDVDVCDAARFADAVGYVVKRRPGASGQVHRGAFPREGRRWLSRPTAVGRPRSDSTATFAGAAGWPSACCAS